MSNYNTLFLTIKNICWNIITLLKKMIRFYDCVSRKQLYKIQIKNYFLEKWPVELLVDHYIIFNWHPACSYYITAMNIHSCSMCNTICYQLLILVKMNFVTKEVGTIWYWVESPWGSRTTALIIDWCNSF